MTQSPPNPKRLVEDLERAKRTLAELAKFDYGERLEAFVEDPSLFEYVDLILAALLTALERERGLVEALEEASQALAEASTELDAAGSQRAASLAHKQSNRAWGFAAEGAE